MNPSGCCTIVSCVPDEPRNPVDVFSLRGRCMARPRAGLLRSIQRRDGTVGWTEGGLSVPSSVFAEVLPAVKWTAAMPLASVLTSDVSSCAPAGSLVAPVGHREPQAAFLHDSIA